MDIALCTPFPHGKPIQTWQRLLVQKGHNAQLVFEPNNFKPQVCMYYGSRLAKSSSVQNAKDARDQFAKNSKTINSKATFDLVRDKQLCAQTFLAANLPHPKLNEKFNSVVIKPRFGFGGDGVVCNIRFEEALEKQKQDPNLLIQEYVEGCVIRVVASKRKALYAYEKVSAAGGIASVAQGAKRRFITIDLALQDLAVQSVNCLGGDLLGLDIIRGKQDYILEANTGFALYPKDIHTQERLISEFEWLAET